MGAKGSKGTFNRQAESRQSQKKTYQKFRQSMTKLTKEVNKVKIQNKEKLLELEIAIKSASNDLEIARTYTEPAFEEMFEDFLKTCEELDQVVKDKLEQNDKNLEEIQQENEGPNNPQNSDRMETEQINISTIQNNETALFAEDFPKSDVKKQKKIKLKEKTDDKLEENKKSKSKNKNKADKVDVNSIISEEGDKNKQLSDSKKDKHKKNKNNKKEVDDNISRDTLDIVEIVNGGTITSKKRFWTFPMRLKRKPSAITSNPDTQQQPIILIQDPENEDRSLQNIEIQQLEKAIKNNNKKDKSKRQSRAHSQFFDQQSDVPPTPSSTPIPSPKLEPSIQQQDPLQEIHNIRMSIGTLEEMTKIYRLTKRGNYDYIYDNLYLCVNKLKDMDQDQNVGVLTLRHENKLAMQQAQNCLSILEGKIEVPERRMSQQSDHRYSGGVPQVVIARSPSKKRDNYQKSVEFIDITNDEEIIDFPMKTNREMYHNEEIAGESTNREKLKRLENHVTQESTDEFSEEDDLKDILMSLEDSVEEINHQQKTAPNKPILITSF